MLKGRIFGIDQQYFFGDQEIIIIIIIIININLYIYMNSKCSTRL
jgi:uncharacterized membrane protein